jgi:hypothetical protein
MTGFEIKEGFDQTERVVFVAIFSWMWGKPFIGDGGSVDIFAVENNFCDPR